MNWIMNQYAVVMEVRQPGTIGSFEHRSVYARAYSEDMATVLACRHFQAQGLETRSLVSVDEVD